MYWKGYSVCPVFEFFFTNKNGLHFFWKKTKYGFVRNSFSIGIFVFDITYYLILIAVASEHNHIKGMSLKL